MGVAKKLQKLGFLISSHFCPFIAGWLSHSPKRCLTGHCVAHDQRGQGRLPHFLRQEHEIEGNLLLAFCLDSPNLNGSYPSILRLRG